MPIIKSKGWKSPGFGILHDYLEKEKPKNSPKGMQPIGSYLHNILGVDTEDEVNILKAFQENDAYRKERANGNALYHEIISFHPKDSTFLLEHPEILEDITRAYLELRAPKALAYACPHLDKAHLHLHIMISGNEMESEQTIRIGKEEFEAVKIAIQEYQLEHYPELENSYVLSRDGKQSNLEQPSEVVQQLKVSLQDAISKANSMEELTKLLESKSLSLYQYNNVYQGLMHESIKYQFTFLFEKESEQFQIINQMLEAEKEETESVLSPYFQPVVDKKSIILKEPNQDSKPSLSNQTPQNRDEKLKEKESLESLELNLELESENSDSKDTETDNSKGIPSPYV